MAIGQLNAFISQNNTNWVTATKISVQLTRKHRTLITIARILMIKIQRSRDIFHNDIPDVHRVWRALTLYCDFISENHNCREKYTRTCGASRIYLFSLLESRRKNDNKVIAYKHQHAKFTCLLTYMCMYIYYCIHINLYYVHEGSQ